jgi:hypothetical protein
MIKKTIRLIYANIDANNNKFWNADLHDNDDWYVVEYNI